MSSISSFSSPFLFVSLEFFFSLFSFISFLIFGFCFLSVLFLIFLIFYYVFGILVGFQWSGGTGVHDRVFGYVMGEKLERRSLGNDDSS